MVLKFPFRKEKSPVLGIIYRPIARVLFWSRNDKKWLALRMVVDTGADYTLLPRYMADKLGVNLEKDCKAFITYGIGGGERVYFLSKIKVRLGDWERIISVGFLERNEIPPLMGRHLFLETFETLFSSNHTLSFSISHHPYPVRHYSGKELKKFLDFDRKETRDFKKEKKNNLN